MTVGNISKKKINVVAAIIFADDGRILIAQRSANDSSGGKWEFPGGKIQPGETSEQALHREIEEELGIALKSAHFWKATEHAYEHIDVHLDFYRCSVAEGAPIVMNVHQRIEWVTIKDAKAYDFLEADVGILDELAEA